MQSISQSVASVHDSNTILENIPSSQETHSLPSQPASEDSLALEIFNKIYELSLNEGMDEDTAAAIILGTGEKSLDYKQYLLLYTPFVLKTKFVKILQEWCFQEEEQKSLLKFLGALLMSALRHSDTWDRVLYFRDNMEQLIQKAQKETIENAIKNAKKALSAPPENMTFEELLLKQKSVSEARRTLQEFNDLRQYLPSESDLPENMPKDNQHIRLLAQTSRLEVFETNDEKVALDRCTNFIRKFMLFSAELQKLAPLLKEASLMLHEAARLEILLSTKRARIEKPITPSQAHEKETTQGEQIYQCHALPAMEAFRKVVHDIFTKSVQELHAIRKRRHTPFYKVLERIREKRKETERNLPKLETLLKHSSEKIQQRFDLSWMEECHDMLFENGFDDQTIALLNTVPEKDIKQLKTTLTTLTSLDESSEQINALKRDEITNVFTSVVTRNNITFETLPGAVIRNTDT